MQIDFTETELLTIENTLLSGYPPDDSVEMQIVKKIQSVMCPTTEHKRVIVTHCNNKLRFVKAVFECTKKDLFECKSIVDQVVKNNKCNGTLLLNESSITPEQWEAVVAKYNDYPDDHIEWYYI